MPSTLTILSLSARLFMEYQIHLFGTQSRIWTFLPMTRIWVAHFGMMSWILAQHCRHPRIIVKWTQKQDPSGMQWCRVLFWFEYEFVYPACAKGGTGKSERCLLICIVAIWFSSYWEYRLELRFESMTIVDKALGFVMLSSDVSCF